MERARAAFSDKGLKLTPLRQSVFQEIAASHKAIGAYDVLDRLAAKGERLAPISVYRAIDALVAAGIVHRFESRNAFFACHAGHDMRQLVLACETCGRVAEVDGDKVFRPSTRPRARRGSRRWVPWSRSRACARGVRGKSVANAWSPRMEGHEPSGEAAALARADRPLARRVGHDHGDHDHHDHAHYDGPALAHDADALISARSLWLSRSGRTILQGVDIDIAAGEIVTLIGPNGAGKTTLVRVLLGLESPDKGTTVRKPGLVVGYVPQRFERRPRHPDHRRALRRARAAGRGRGDRAHARRRRRRQDRRSPAVGSVRRRAAAGAARARADPLARRAGARRAGARRRLRGRGRALQPDRQAALREAASACCSCRTTCTSSWRRATASSASTGMCAARACRSRWRSIPSTRACSGRRPPAPSASIITATTTATIWPASRIPPRARMGPSRAPARSGAQ